MNIFLCMFLSLLFVLGAVLVFVIISWLLYLITDLFDLDTDVVPELALGLGGLVLILGIIMWICTNPREPIEATTEPQIIQVLK